jgi:hypothetical protein
MGLFVFHGTTSMAEVVYLAERKPIPPKSITDKHAGHRYTCTFDPNAPPGEQWVWHIDFTRVYRFYGAARTAEAATKAARLKIHSLTLRRQAEEENE